MYVCFFAQNERLLRLVNQQISEASYHFFNQSSRKSKLFLFSFQNHPLFLPEVIQFLGQK